MRNRMEAGIEAQAPGILHIGTKGGQIVAMDEAPPALLRQSSVWPEDGFPDFSQGIIKANTKEGKEVRAKAKAAASKLKINHWAKPKPASLAIAAQMMKTVAVAFPKASFNYVRTTQRGLPLSVDTGLSLRVDMRLEGSKINAIATTTDYSIPGINADLQSDPISRYVSEDKKFTYKLYMETLNSIIIEAVDQIREGRGTVVNDYT